MGKPSWRRVQLPAPEYIGCSEGTWGSETSQYPQEEKTKVIPRVVASEIGRGETMSVCYPAGVAGVGLWGCSTRSAGRVQSKKLAVEVEVHWKVVP